MDYPNLEFIVFDNNSKQNPVFKLYGSLILTVLDGLEFVFQELDVSFLTISWRGPLSYRNQSIELLCKSMDWFLYDNDPRHEKGNWILKHYCLIFFCFSCINNGNGSNFQSNYKVSWTLLTLICNHFLGTFWCLTFHHKWNEARLLIMNMVHTSCLTSCRTN